MLRFAIPSQNLPSSLGADGIPPALQFDFVGNYSVVKDRSGSATDAGPLSA
jgi:hypothetical protein